ncbi:integrin beta-1-binding protein 1 isoform X2 [Cuculus canorus]|uniref:integrin beta-1-binding protein 1 isoform X2 n=1 Tax=Cuculus canorus TaxID=55661 RepID=UPI0023AB05F1|nr:integrin beta-1-binding protein 1 isoform X2 [Cuculus canorus]
MFRKGKKRHSSSSSQSSEISTKSKSVDSSLGGLSRSSTVASLDTDSTKSSGQSNSNSDTCAEFRVKYVGAIEKLKYSESKNLEGPLDLINYIDVAQMESYLLFQAKRSLLWEFPNMALKFQHLISIRVHGHGAQFIHPSSRRQSPLRAKHWKEGRKGICRGTMSFKGFYPSSSSDNLCAY